MTEGPLFVSHTVQVRRDVYEEAIETGRAIAAEMARLAAMTPAEIVAERAEREREAREARAAERKDSARAALTLDTLVDRLGWSRAYALHYVQPFCRCDPFGEDMVLCGHAEDEGLEGPW